MLGRLLTEPEPWECAIVAAVLAPTDAALGQAVVSSPALPLRIPQALSVESGLNDGGSVPFLMLVIALALAALAVLAWFFADEIGGKASACSRPTCSQTPRGRWSPTA